MNGADKAYAVELSAEDYQKGYVEVAFLLDAFASTVDNIMGGNTAPVGRIAGRDTAKKLPLQPADRTIGEVVAALGEMMQAGFDFSLDKEELLFRRCILREMCRTRGINTGGALCRLFHAYLDGIANGLICRPVKSEVLKVGEEECSFRIDVQ